MLVTTLFNYLLLTSYSLTCSCFLKAFVVAWISAERVLPGPNPMFCFRFQLGLFGKSVAKQYTPHWGKDSTSSFGKNLWAPFYPIIMWSMRHVIKFLFSLRWSLLQPLTQALALIASDSRKEPFQAQTYICMCSVDGTLCFWADKLKQSQSSKCIHVCVLLICSVHPLAIYSHKVGVLFAVANTWI